MIGTFNPEREDRKNRIREAIDLREVAGRDTTLRHCARHGDDEELEGPCPNSGCEARNDGFHVTRSWFTCYSCHQRHGDIYEYLQWLNPAMTFPDALAKAAGLAGEVVDRPAAAASPRSAKPSKPSEWTAEDWQKHARGLASVAAGRLDAPAGEPGQAYLAGRGLERDTWRAWGLGYDPAKWDPATRSNRPAIVVPWFWGKAISAVKYRFIDPLAGQDKGRRFIAKGDSDCRLFGLQLRSTGADALILVEGEFNALSIWQALRVASITGVDVVSFGSEGRGGSDWAAKLARQYQNVVVWCDETENAQAAALATGGAYALRSPRGMDANDLLRNNILPLFLAGALERFGVRVDPVKAVVEPLIDGALVAVGPDGSIDWDKVAWNHAANAHPGAGLPWVRDGSGWLHCPVCIL